MPVANYGVLKSKLVSTYLERDDASPHYQIHCRDEVGMNYRIAVNVQSQLPPSELLYLAVEDFPNSVLEPFLNQTGYQAIRGKQGIDYIRGHFFDPRQLKAVPYNVAGPDNDLLEFLDEHLQDAVGNNADLFVFGSKFSGKGKDKTFRFSPVNGMHNVHMNQGNSKQFRNDDGIWQDGALLIRFPESGRVKAIFLAFQSQSWSTDDQGHAFKAARTKKI